MTLAAWYRATTIGTRGSEIVSGADKYVLRIRGTTELEFSKLRSGGYAQCFATVPNLLDGNWHHVAGVTTPAGMTSYFDGVVQCSNIDGSDISYNTNQTFWVGRHGGGEITWNFDGNIDDVRVYSRALSPAEIRRLAEGAN